MKTCKLLIISNEPHAAETYLRLFPAEQKQRIETIQLAKWQDVRDWIRKFGLGSIDAIIASALRLSSGPTTLMLISEICEVYPGPIIVVGKRKSGLDWVGEALKAGATHQAETLADIPRLFQELSKV